MRVPTCSPIAPFSCSWVSCTYTFYVVIWVYLAALFLFELGSLICGVAPSSTALIVGGAIAGKGGGGVTNGSLLVIVYSVPSRK